MKNEKKRLHIGLKEDIREIVDKYCAESGIDDHSVTFAMGFLSGKVDDDVVAIQQLSYLLQAYFFAGIYYHKTSSKKLDYGYLTNKEYKAKMVDKKTVISKPKINPSYVG